MNFINKIVQSLNRSVIRYFLCYILIIIIFSLIYYRIWIKNPNCFLINDLLNSMPTSEIVEEIILHQEDYDFQNTPPVFIDYYESIHSNFSELSILEGHAKSLLDTFKIATFDDIYPGQIADSLNIEVLVNPFDTDFLDSVQTLTNHYLANNTSDEHSLTEIYNYLFTSNEEIELTKNNSIHRCFTSCDLLPENYRVRETIERLVFVIYHNFLTLTAYDNFWQKVKEQYFANNIDYRCITHIKNVMQKYYDNYNVKNPKVWGCFNYLKRMENTLTRFYNKTYMFKKFQKTRLSYFDLLYFSTTTSTTTGYGDIAPNCIEIRICVIIQTISSLIVLGLLLNFIRKKDIYS